MNGSRRRNSGRRNDDKRNDGRRNDNRRNDDRRNGIEEMIMIKSVYFGGIVIIENVFIYFEILTRSLRVRVRSAEVCFYNIFTVNSTINRLINMHSIEI
jgi:hypothetical protein